MDAYLFDTCFLIDLEREMRREPGKAHRFLQQHSSARACLSWTVAGEFAAGFGDIHHPACATLLSRFEILELGESTAHQYAVTTRALSQRGQLIGANDHWVAAAALAHSLPLVTNNASHFGRIESLAIVRY
jgi:tRNA(fMet)-specific endonuclease VapC